MSQWRIALRALHSAGKPMSVQEIETAVGGSFEARGAMHRAQLLGLARSSLRGRHASWSITDRGIAWCEGRIVERQAPRACDPSRRRYRFVATWLSSLPRDIRITADTGAGA